MHLITPTTEIVPTNEYKFHKTGNVLRLYRSCLKNDIFLKLIGLGNEYHQFFKHDCMKKYIKNLKDNDIVMTIDAYDMYLTCSKEEILEKFYSFNTPIVVSADTICYPYTQLEESFLKQSKSVSFFHYLNLGGIIGYVGYLKEVFKKLDKYQKDLSNSKFNEIYCKDQLSWQWYFLYDQENQETVTIDYNCQIWQTLGGRQNLDKMMRKKKGRFMNKETGIFPCFIHGAGSVGFKSMERLLDE